MRKLSVIACLALVACTPGEITKIEDTAHVLRDAIVDTCKNTSAKGTPSCDKLVKAYNDLQQVLP